MSASTRLPSYCPSLTVSYSTANVNAAGEDEDSLRNRVTRHAVQTTGNKRDPPGLESCMDSWTTDGHTVVDVTIAFPLGDAILSITERGDIANRPHAVQLTSSPNGIPIKFVPFQPRLAYSLPDVHRPVRRESRTLYGTLPGSPRNWLRLVVFATQSNTRRTLVGARGEYQQDSWEYARDCWLDQALSSSSSEVLVFWHSSWLLRAPSCSLPWCHSLCSSCINDIRDNWTVLNPRCTWYDCWHGQLIHAHAEPRCI